MIDNTNHVEMPETCEMEMFRFEVSLASLYASFLRSNSHVVDLTDFEMGWKARPLFVLIR